MSGETGKETVVEQKVTYVLEQQGRIVISYSECVHGSTLTIN